MASESDRNAPDASRVTLAHVFSPPCFEERATATEGGRDMLYLRTASGSFINAAKIIALSPQHDDASEEIAGWIATCADGEAVVLAAYYCEPGRLEQAIRFMPAVDIRLPEQPAT